MRCCERVLASPGHGSAPTSPARSARPSRTSSRRWGTSGSPSPRSISASRRPPRATSPSAGCEVHVLPATSTAADLLAVDPDGVFFSNGPGDPATADGPVAALQGVLGVKPVFGICFGNQVLGRALGFGTYKLKFGHRGVNQPVQDRATGRVAITSHNHGFAVDAPLDGPVHDRVRPGRGQPRRPQRRRRRGPALPRRAGVLGAVPPRGRARPARRDRPVRPFAELMAADLMPAPHRHQQRPGHRLRPDRDRPGLRVRLLRHPGLPGAARGGSAGQPDQLQPGDDHDRPGVRRRDLHRADHPGVRREGHRAGAAGRAARDARRPDRAQRRGRAARARRARAVTASS